MGRKAGHLALGIGKAAGATLTIIPEEFASQHITLDDVSRVIEGSILKRRLNGQTYGVAVVGEGVGESIDPEELRARRRHRPVYDPHGHIALAEIPLGSMIKQRVHPPLRGARPEDADDRRHPGLRAALRPALALRHRLHADAGLGRRAIPARRALGPTADSTAAS